MMNNYFCSIGTELANKIDYSSNPLLSGEYHINDKSEKFNFRPVNVQNIRDALAKAKTSKSFGNDNISYFFLKLALPYIENSLAILFNTSIQTSVFPDAWKLARVTPIFKEGDKDDKSNYRPISVLPAISRLFEKLITNQLYQYIEKNGLFSSDQSGFLRQHSTLTCLLKSTDDWYRGLDLGKLVGLVFIDLKKAFDTVDHDILCQKLQHYGVCQRELSWFKSYLSNRKQFCRVSGTDSKAEDITIGVPQGSCLGPLLFLIYINDLPLAITNSNTSMYADDTSICYHSHDITQLNEAINRDLYSLEKWLEGNKLSLNVVKTRAMLISTKQKYKALQNQSQDLHLKIKGVELDTVTNTRYLGVNIDSSLDWKDHIKAISTKVSRAVGFLKYTRNFLPQDTLKTLYTGIVEPHFRYCCSVWGSCGKTDLNQLQKLQNRAARIVTNSSYDAPSKPLLQKLEWKTIVELIANETKMMVFKSLNDFGPQYMLNMFTKNSQLSERNLRNTTTDLRLPLRKSTAGQKSFSYRGAKMWNSLSTECKETRSLRVFKSLLK